MATYRSKICKPDKKGFYRPEVGGKRFTVGHKNDISAGEAQRRLPEQSGLDRDSRRGHQH